jgi:hypothetical protein
VEGTPRSHARGSSTGFDHSSVMIVFSVIASVVGTVLLNLLL